MDNRLNPYDRFWLVLMFVIAAAIRLCTLARRIEFDESVLIYIARQPLATGFSLILNRLGGGQTHLFGVILHFLLALSSNTIVVRSAMLCFELAGLYVAYLVARRLFNNAVALYTVAVVACAEPYIYHSTELKVYSLWLFLSMLSVYFFIRILSAPSGRWYAGWAVTTVAGLYAHFFGILLLMAEIVVWLAVFRRLRLQLSVFLLSGACMAIALIPLKLFLYDRCLPYPYVAEYYFSSPAYWPDVYNMFVFYCGHRVLLACVVVIILAGIFSHARINTKRMTPEDAALKLFAVLGFVVPVAAIFLLHPWRMSFFREERYLLSCFVFFFMLFSFSLMRLPLNIRKWLVPVFLSLLMVNGLRYGVKIGRMAPLAPIKPVASYLASHREPQDKIAMRNVLNFMQIFNELHEPYTILTDADEINNIYLLKTFLFDQEKMYMSTAQLKNIKRLWCVVLQGTPPLPWFDDDPRIVLKETKIFANAEIRLYEINL